MLLFGTSIESDRGGRKTAHVPTQVGASTSACETELHKLLVSQTELAAHQAKRNAFEFDYYAGGSVGTSVGQ